MTDSLSKAENAIAPLESSTAPASMNSPVHRVHPMVKLVVTALYICAVISIPGGKVSVLVPFVLYFAVLLPLSDTGVKMIALRVLPALPFSLAIGTGNLIMMRNAAFQVGGITVTAGMLSFASIMLKTVFTVSAVLLLAATTSFVTICNQLRTLGVPKVFCLQLAMTYRYTGVLLAETKAMFTSYTLRSSRKTILMRDMGVFLGQLILRSFDRAGRVYTAMKLRGFDGNA